jgi:hypothetical protein
MNQQESRSFRDRAFSLQKMVSRNLLFERRHSAMQVTLSCAATRAVSPEISFARRRRRWCANRVVADVEKQREAFPLGSAASSPEYRTGG